MAINQNGRLHQRSQGASYLVGDLCSFNAIKEQTDEAYALFELFIPAHSSSEAHIHSQSDEAFYILEGSIEFQLEEQTIMATKGTFLTSPKGHLHKFTNIGSTSAKMLCWDFREKRSM